MVFHETFYVEIWFFSIPIYMSMYESVHVSIALSLSFFSSRVVIKVSDKLKIRLCTRKSHSNNLLHFLK